MANLKLNQPTVFIMLGYPGAGKTTFAQQFAARTGSVHVSADRIRHELFEEPRFTAEENDVVQRIMNYMYEELISQGISIVYDANNNRRNRRAEIRDVAKKHDAEVLIVWVQTDLETAYERANNRDRRKTENKYAHQIDRDTFERMRSQLTKPKFEEYVVISGKHVFRNQLHAVQRGLQKMELMGEKAPPKQTRKITLGGRVDLTRRQQRPSK